MEIIVLIGLAYALASAWDYAKSHRSASRSAASPASSGGGGTRRSGARHAIGWWAREAGSGFAVHRTGWHAGWLAHQAEHDQHRTAREEARTGQMGKRADYLKHRNDHRERQDEIRARIAGELERSGQPAGGRKAVREAAGKVLPFRRRGEPAPASEPESVPEPVVVPAAPPAPVPQAPATPAGPSPEGSRPMADTNYAKAVERAKAFAAAADQDIVTIRKRRDEAQQIGDEMQALDVDALTLSEQMELSDKLAGAEKEHVAIGEAATQVADGLARRHGGIQAAVDDAPIDQPAHREFYTE